MRKFEKVSYDEFSKSTGLDKDVYDNFSLPKRSTKLSAGYDFVVLSDFVIEPGEIKMVPTGVKVSMESTDVLMLFIRSSLGFKYNIRLCNQVGVIDSDYYNNPDNEGHMFIKLQNEGNESKVFKTGDRFVQGVFLSYLVTDDDILASDYRTGGIGSTDKEDNNG